MCQCFFIEREARSFVLASFEENCHPKKRVKTSKTLGDITDITLKFIQQCVVFEIFRDVTFHRSVAMAMAYAKNCN